MNPYQLPEEQMLVFGLLFLRVIAFFVAMPIVGTSSVPSPIKVLFSLAFAMTMFPVVQATPMNQELLSDSLIWLCGKELMVGLFLGFLVRMFFFSMSVAGDIVGMTAGFSAAQMFNPALGESGTAMDFFHVLLGTSVFLILGGHHMFILGFAQSFQFLPISSMGFNLLAPQAVVDLGAEVIATGFRLASPIWVALLIANLAMGLLGRAVPYINTFVLSFHVTIMLAFGILIIMMPMLVGEMHGIIDLMASGFFKTVRTL